MAPPASVKVRPRIIIHGGAGNIKPQAMTEDYYQKYRESLLSIVRHQHAYHAYPAVKLSIHQSNQSLTHSIDNVHKRLHADTKRFFRREVLLISPGVPLRARDRYLRRGEA